MRKRRTNGECYDYGSGVAVDENEAEKWYQKAAENGNETAMLTLADKLFVDGSLDDTDEKMQKAAMWYQESCGTGKHGKDSTNGEIATITAGVWIKMRKKP